MFLFVARLCIGYYFILNHVILDNLELTCPNYPSSVKIMNTRIKVVYHLDGS